MNDEKLMDENKTLSEQPATGGKNLPDAELMQVLKTSFFGALGVTWAVGGLVAVVALFNFHWAVGWVALFVWVWGCWAAYLYFGLKRFLPSL